MQATTTHAGFHCTMAVAAKRHRPMLAWRKTECWTPEVSNSLQATRRNGNTVDWAWLSAARTAGPAWWSVAAAAPTGSRSTGTKSAVQDRRARWVAPLNDVNTHLIRIKQSQRRNATQTRAVRRRAGGRRRRWPAEAASDRMREHWNSALAGQAFFSGFTGVSHFTRDLC